MDRQNYPHRQRTPEDKPKVDFNGYPSIPDPRLGVPDYGEHKQDTYVQPKQPSYQSHYQKVGFKPPQPPPQKSRSVKKRKLPIIKWLMILLLAAVLVVGVVFAINKSNENKRLQAAQSYVNQYDQVFLDTVYVDGICLKGMSFEEGKARVEAQIAEKKNGWYILMSNNHGESDKLTADDLGLGWDATAALTNAWAVGHTEYSGNNAVYAKQSEIQLALTEPHYFYSAEQSLNTAVIDSMLETLAQNAYRAPVDAQYLGFNPDDADDPFSYQSESYGQMLDVSSVREQILTLAENFTCGEVVLTTVPLEPDVTVEELKKQRSLRYRAYTPISSKSTEERTENIRNALSKINGLTLDNGESFSFNKVVGKRSLKNGFLYAVEYIYGNEEVGIGGGVCQASTTVYQAAVQAGMTITKRRAHSMAVSYADLGMDATVSDTKGHEIDFSFVNNSGGTIYLVARVTNSHSSKKNLQCEVSIWGPSLENTSYQLVAQTVETLPKPEEPTYVKDESALYVTYTDQEKVVSKGREGYVVESYLVIYENQTETKRQLLYTDTYPAKADTVYVGITPRDE